MIAMCEDEGGAASGSRGFVECGCSVSCQLNARDKDAQSKAHDVIERMIYGAGVGQLLTANRPRELHSSGAQPSYAFCLFILVYWREGAFLRTHFFLDLTRALLEVLILIDGWSSESWPRDFRTLLTEGLTCPMAILRFSE